MNMTENINIKVYCHVSEVIASPEYDQNERLVLPWWWWFFVFARRCCADVGFFEELVDVMTINFCVLHVDSTSTSSICTTPSISGHAVVVNEYLV